MNKHEPCDCLNRCGDDSRVSKGAVQPCAQWINWSARARIIEVRRDEANPLALVVIYNRPPDPSDARALQNFDRWPAP